MPCFLLVCLLLMSTYLCMCTDIREVEFHQRLLKYILFLLLILILSLSLGDVQVAAWHRLHKCLLWLRCWHYTHSSCWGSWLLQIMFPYLETQRHWWLIQTVSQNLRMFLCQHEELYRSVTLYLRWIFKLMCLLRSLWDRIRPATFASHSLNIRSFLYRLSVAKDVRWFITFKKFILHN